MRELVPTGTVTLLAAGVDSASRTGSDEAVPSHDDVIRDVGAAHAGSAVERADGIVVAFTRPSDAVACAIELQQAPWAPVRLRIGVHTGEVPSGNGGYAGPTLVRAAGLRDLAHGGQTLLSGVTEDLVVDRLPDQVWLTDLGSHRLPQRRRPERVFQLCHSELRNDFPPLRTEENVASQSLPVQLTSFVGREMELHDIPRMLADHRVVTLTGAGGVGKTRLAVEVATHAEGFADGMCYVDLAPISDPNLLPVAVIRALHLPDHPALATTDTLVRFLADRELLVIVDNCEHLLEACATLVLDVLAGCPRVTLMATSREPLGVPCEITVRVPPLSQAAAEKLFSDRAHQVRPEFGPSGSDPAALVEICQRLDGMPLAIELAAARVRVLSLNEIRDGLHDRFRLLTGGARTAVRRQQTLRASVDWSHALLTEPERTLFARLGVFSGGFDLAAAEEVACDDEVARYHVLDLMTLLVDKSLVVAESISGRTRYRLLETVRQYAQEKLGESGHADATRMRHCDHYSALADSVDAPGGHRHLERAEAEIDNLRAAFTWSRESSVERAAQLASSLQPLWLARGHMREGVTWLDAALDDPRVASLTRAMRARLLADRATLNAYLGATDGTEQAEAALAIARAVDDPALLLRALVARGGIAVYDPDAALPCFEEAIVLARSSGDDWRASQILAWLAYGSVMAGDPGAICVTAVEGRDLADAIVDRSVSHGCRWSLAVAQGMTGDIVDAVTHLRDLVADADAAHDLVWKSSALFMSALMLAHHGDTVSALKAASAAVLVAQELGGFYLGLAYAGLTAAHLSAGDADAATAAIAAGAPHLRVQPKQASIWIAYAAQAALARGDLDAARTLADDAVAGTRGFHLSLALTTRAGVTIARGDVEGAARDAHDALVTATTAQAFGAAGDTLECLALLAVIAASHAEAARLYGAAQAIRRRHGQVRFAVFDLIHDTSISGLRDTMGENDFDTAWAEGASLTTAQAIAYAQRRRGERKRPSSGWAALTPTERDVVRLVSEGLANKDIATRLFVSPRTVQTHLTHVYRKLGLRSRVQLAQEAGRR